MATAYFVDSSALVKRYVRETGTAWVRGITRRRPSTDIYIALITAVEVTSAIARRRGGTLSRRREPPRSSAVPQAPGRALSPLADHARPDERRHEAGERHRLRAYDAVQLAAALDVYRDWSANRFGRSCSSPPTATSTPPPPPKG